MTHRLLAALMLITTYASAGTISGTISLIANYDTRMTRSTYDLLLTDGPRSLSMHTLYTYDVAGQAYSPVVFNGFDATCSVSWPDPAPHPCSWNTSQAYDFQYWSPGRYGEPAPIQLHIETPGASIWYPGGYFRFHIDLAFTGGSATLPLVSGSGAVSSVNDLPVSFVLDIAVYSVVPGDGLVDARFLPGQCVWCASYSGEGLAGGTSTLKPLPQADGPQSRFYGFAGQEVPEPATPVLVLVGAAMLWVKRLKRAN